MFLPFLGTLEASSGGSKLWNEYSNNKIREEITLEMRKMQGNLKFLHDHDKFYNFTKSLKITRFGV